MTTSFNVRGKLTVTVHSARDLTVKQVIGEMDPYVKFSVRTEKFKTPVAENGHRAPKWEYSFIANLDGDEDAVHMKVYNKGNVTDDIMSRADVELPNLDLSGQPVWYSLRDPENFQKTCGEISLTLTFAGTGLPAGSKAFITHAQQTGSPSPITNSAPVAALSPISPTQYQPPPQYQQPQQYQPPQPQQQQYQPQQPIQQQPQQPMYQQPQPVYQAPQPAYQPVYQQAQPQPIAYQPPQPVYQTQQPVYQQPQPVVYQQPLQPVQQGMIGGFMAGVNQFANSVAQSVAAATTTRGKWDSNGYLTIHPDVKNAGQDGFQHFCNYGFNEKRDIVLTNGARGKWDGAGYLAIHPDVKNAGMDAFQHFRQYGHKEGRDIAIIQTGSAPVMMMSPTSAGMQNRGKWDSNGYLRMHPDVKNAGQDAFTHYGNHGFAEGREIQLTNGLRGRFDSFAYLTLHPDVKNAGMDGFVHYKTYGNREGRDIAVTLTQVVGKWDGEGYLVAHPDVRNAGMNGIDHFRQYGYKEGRRVSVVAGGQRYTGTFNGPEYVKLHEDLVQARVDGFDHYQSYGNREGRDMVIRV